MKDRVGRTNTQLQHSTNRVTEAGSGCTVSQKGHVTAVIRGHLLGEVTGEPRVQKKRFRYATVLNVKASPFPPAFMCPYTVFGP